MFVMKQPDLGATAADTFRESFVIDDEETGNVHNGSDGNASIPTASQPSRRGRAGWILAGMLGLLLVVALSVGLATRNRGGIESATAATSPEAPAGTATTLADVPTDANEAEIEPVEDSTDEKPNNAATASDSSAPNLFNDVFSSSSADDADGSPGESKPFQPEPEQEVGDASLIAEPEDLVAAITSSPTASPTTFQPTTGSSASPSLQPSTAESASPSTQPTMEPSNGPTAKPTASPSVTPSASPSNKPTSEPTEQPISEPTASPSGSPTNKPIDLTGWTTFNWSGETDAPSSSPTSKPTPQPTDEPTKKPTLQPTTELTPAPTSEPTPAPTSEPTTSPTNEPIASPTASPTPAVPFFFGEEFYIDPDLEIQISKGLSVRAIAWTGQPVPYADGEKSKLNYHEDSDAAGIISMDPTDPLNSGYVYVSNAESGDGEGGAYGIYFDKDGNVLEYKALLTGTTDNCGGGYTPWNTWVSCEEYEDGQCHEIDPVASKTKETALGGDGGRYESVACDDRDHSNLKFFTTEDHERGALRRYETSEYGWGALHGGGSTTFLHILDDNTYEWTTDEELGRDSAEEYFPNAEGIQVHEGKLYFMSKVDRKLLVLDLEDMTYTAEITGKKMYGEGDFGDQPDQNYFGPTRKFMYFTEDGGGDPGVHARYGDDGTYFTLFQAIEGGRHDGDETVGIALSPDHTRFYAGFQEYGILFEITRDDGRAFE